MSVEVDWETLTGGPDGQLRAETIRRFLHDKFQQVPLPRFIRAVNVSTFDFGSVPPEVEIKDICDPLPDFYEDDDSEDEDGDEDDNGDGDDGNNNGREGGGGQGGQGEAAQKPAPLSTVTTSASTPTARMAVNTSTDFRRPLQRQQSRDAAPLRSRGLQPSQHPHGSRTSPFAPEQLLSPLLQRSSTPGIPGGTSNISYFHLPLSAGLSGTATPLAAVAGAQFQPAWANTDLLHHHPTRLPQWASDLRHHEASISSSVPSSTADPSSRPPSQHQPNLSRKSSRLGGDDSQALPEEGRTSSASPPPRSYNPGPMDIQVVSHVKYTGDIKMVLTAEIHMDYPMQSFVGIPLKLTVTGLSFDGVAILAYIRRKAHFCFLSQEDAATVLSGEPSGSDSTGSDGPDQNSSKRYPAGGSLLEHIKVESEIGQKDDGRQVLKNVGKVEKFVLERVRKIFEEELVYPSFWTFLV